MTWLTWLTWLARLSPRERRKSQAQLAGRTAEVIDHVVYDVGIETLVRGTLVLDKRFRLCFTGGHLPARGVLAAVRLGELAEADIFRAVGSPVALDVALLRVHMGCLVFAVMREFRSQSAVIRALP